MRNSFLQLLSMFFPLKTKTWTGCLCNISKVWTISMFFPLKTETGTFMQYNKRLEYVHTIKHQRWLNNTFTNKKEILSFYLWFFQIGIGAAYDLTFFFFSQHALCLEHSSQRAVFYEFLWLAKNMNFFIPSIFLTRIRLTKLRCRNKVKMQK